MTTSSSTRSGVVLRYYELDRTLVRVTCNEHGDPIDAHAYEPATDSFVRALPYLSKVETHPYADELSAEAFEHRRELGRGR